MDIRSLDHFTLRTRCLPETTAFFEQVAGLRVGPRPAFKFDGRWLYRGDWAALHLAVYDPADEQLRAYLGDRQATPGNTGTGAVDHIAFRCNGLPSFEARLRSLTMPYRARTVPDLHEHQVFVVDPNGVTVEFIFSSSEDASWEGTAEYAPAQTSDTV
ncbi:extradiol dioxygenase [Paraburkholderia strydomiana]|uniref:Extradiol dioxygenase n=1 Tax=Paraburkholderia strydomiana TaxID=1245417 RepID=A0ABW9ERE3_9BURK